ncbi:PREDICTED: fasciclin-2 isoform X3 [Dinoponera quadriceps]|uniref:Fasciclin-2 isoform X3 n=1 Tax=Dinoponera quadriceps TaxID=609295 RepID=A0A6P3XGA4_DINQU|nr:PREDICTED: fasciclin-2 isoform X3 [Dinoponera quadriceps]
MHALSHVAGGVLKHVYTRETMNAETTTICLSVLCIYVMTAPSPSTPPPPPSPSLSPSPSPRPSETTPPRPTDVAYASPLEPHLEILPSGETHSKPIGTSIILTCKPKVDQPNLINDMKWLDTRNRTIEPVSLLVLPLKSSHTGQQKPAMYTERYADGSLALFINSLDENQAGKYSCIGTYANSVTMSKSITIEAIIAITWENAPLDQHPILGEDFPIQCQVRARPAPLVDWLYNGELIRTNNRYIIDKFTLTIKDVQESDDGVYTCRASVQATGELKERPIKVEVYTRPSIEEFSSPVEIIEGENANIACKASGKPPPTLSWIKTLTHMNLSEADRFGVDPYTGMLTITDVKREDAGEYQCAAKSPAGDASMNILVNVIVKPKIMEFTNMSVVEKKQVDIMCKAFGRPPPEVTFRKFTADKQYVMGAQPNDDRIIMINKQNEMNGETVGNLTILNALRSDDGLYECIAKNRGGAAYKNGHLTVEYPPSFRLMPNITMWSWDKRTVNLTCIAESIPNATIRWTMHGDQKIENHAMIQQIDNGPISVLSVTPIDNRYYTHYKCIASNVHGTRDHLIELREAKRPGNLLDVKMTEISATTITFGLIPPKHPDLPVNSITVQYKKLNDIWPQSKNRTWTVGSRYTVEDLTPMTSYDFRFAAMNEVGLGNWGNDFHEMTPGKTAPMQPKIMTKNTKDEYEISPYNNQYELAWKTPADNGEPIDLYQIKYCQIKRVSGDWDTLHDSCVLITVKPQNRHWLKDLNSDSFYTVELQAHNAMGFSSAGLARFKTSRGENTVVQHQGPLISSAAIIGIVIAILFVIILIIDVICCCAHKTGVIFYVCERSRRKPIDEDDAKLGRDEKEPLKEEKKITPIIDSGLRRETSITFDGKRSVSKTGFVGKDSAV